MKLFLGCSSETLTEARQVSNLLSSLGLQVWFEEKSIVSGETSENEREAALNSADLIIQVISRKAKNNTEETPPELRRSLELLQTRPVGEAFLIPVIVGDVLLPAELALQQYVRFARHSWPLHIARLITRGFEQSGEPLPDTLRSYVESDAKAGGRINLEIRDSNESRELQANYFKYRFPGQYFEFVNARISTEIMGRYFSRRALPKGPSDSDKPRWYGEAQEFFRLDQLISLRIRHDAYLDGVHIEPLTNVLNFAGEYIGEIKLPSLFDYDENTKRFMIDVVRTTIEDKLHSYGKEAHFYIDFNRYAQSKIEGWKLLDGFNFDHRGLTFIFGPALLLPAKYGIQEVTIEWEYLKDKVAPAFRPALKAILR